MDQTYKLWEKYDEQVNITSSKVKELNDKIKPIVETVKQLEEALGRINQYRFEELVKNIEQYSRMYGENKEMIEFLMKNFKKE